MTNKEVSPRVAEWLNGCVKGTWSINEQGKIDVKGRVCIEDAYVKELPVSFGKVEGVFMCRCAHLVSVKGLPEVCQQLIFDRCLFPAHYYLGAVEHHLSVEEYLREFLSQIQIGEDEVDAIKRAFPTLYQEKRGRLTGKKFGF